VVFSSLNHALADLLDPGRLGHQIGCGTLAADVERIAEAVAEPEGWRADPEALADLLESCVETALIERWGQALMELDQQWSQFGFGQTALRAVAPWRLRLQGLVRRLWRSAR
jgi:hypothetical protein